MQRLISLPDEQTGGVRAQLSAMLFGRRRAFEDVHHLLPGCGASDADMRIPLRRISDLVSLSDGRPRFACLNCEFEL